MHDMLLTIDNQKEIGLGVLDFTKAFDCVSLRKLVLKRFFFVLGDSSIVHWIQDYLIDRKVCANS